MMILEDHLHVLLLLESPKYLDLVLMLDQRLVVYLLLLYSRSRSRRRHRDFILLISRGPHGRQNVNAK